MLRIEDDNGHDVVNRKGTNHAAHMCDHALYGMAHTGMYAALLRLTMVCRCSDY